MLRTRLPPYVRHACYLRSYLHCSPRTFHSILTRRPLSIVRVYAPRSFCRSSGSSDSSRTREAEGRASPVQFSAPFPFGLLRVTLWHCVIHYGSGLCYFIVHCQLPPPRPTTLADQFLEFCDFALLRSSHYRCSRFKRFKDVGTNAKK